jgi:hypothetical protein
MNRPKQSFRIAYTLEVDGAIEEASLKQVLNILRGNGFVVEVSGVCVYGIECK